PRRVPGGPLRLRGRRPGDPKDPAREVRGVVRGARTPTCRPEEAGGAAEGAQRRAAQRPRRDGAGQERLAGGATEERPRAPVRRRGCDGEHEVMSRSRNVPTSRYRALSCRRRHGVGTCSYLQGTYQSTRNPHFFRSELKGAV